MKRIFLSLILTAATLPWATTALAQKFEDNFEDKTLRLDYIVAGNQSRGCCRPAQVCRMRINEVDDFCPVCQRAIRRITDFYTGK